MYRIPAYLAIRLSLGLAVFLSLASLSAATVIFYFRLPNNEVLICADTKSSHQDYSAQQATSTFDTNEKVFPLSGSAVMFGAGTRERDRESFPQLVRPILLTTTKPSLREDAFRQHWGVICERLRQEVFQPRLLGTEMRKKSTVLSDGTVQVTPVLEWSRYVVVYYPISESAPVKVELVVEYNGTTVTVTPSDWDVVPWIQGIGNTEVAEETISGQANPAHIEEAMRQKLIERQLLTLPRGHCGRQSPHHCNSRDTPGQRVCRMLHLVAHLNPS